MNSSKLNLIPGHKTKQT